VSIQFIVLYFTLFVLCSIESIKSAHQLELSQELQKLKNSYKLQEQQWVNKEYEYKKKVQQLETRVCTLAL